MQSVPITTDVVSSNHDQGECTTLCDKVCQWFYTGPPVSSYNKTDRHDITEILLKVASNTIKQTNGIPYFLDRNLANVKKNLHWRSNPV
jgi:hypothetical protein